MANPNLSSEAATSSDPTSSDPTSQGLLSDTQVIERVFEHIDNGSTDESEVLWQEPTANYSSEERFAAELELLRRVPTVFCPSAALPEPGSYVARSSAGTPLVVVRGEDGEVRAFRNACRHRGMQVANGSGCAKVFVCGYHGWAYRLDGRLEYIPHDRGFPQVDKSEFGLVPVAVEERHGLVFITQDQPISRGALDNLFDVITPDQQLFNSTDKTTDVNWKLNAEATLEGYHIKPTHPETFYPYGYDNLTIVELFGRNSRVTFPFRRIEKLRNLPPAERVIDGMVTYTYQLYPNVTVAVLSNHTSVSIAEPLSPTRTRFINYFLTNRKTAIEKSGPADAESAEDKVARAKRDASFVTQQGLKEDQAMVQAIQEGLASGANSHFTYGRFETGIAHFHKTLTEGLERLQADA